MLCTTTQTFSKNLTMMTLKQRWMNHFISLAGHLLHHPSLNDITAQHIHTIKNAKTWKKLLFDGAEKDYTNSDSQSFKCWDIIFVKSFCTELIISSRMEECCSCSSSSRRGTGAPNGINDASALFKCDSNSWSTAGSQAVPVAAKFCQVVMNWLCRACKCKLY